MSTPWKGKLPFPPCSPPPPNNHPTDSGPQWKPRPSPRATSSTFFPPKFSALDSVLEVPKAPLRIAMSSDGTARSPTWIVLCSMSIRYHVLINLFRVSSFLTEQHIQLREMLSKSLDIFTSRTARDASTWHHVANPFLIIYES